MLIWNWFEGRWHISMTGWIKRYHSNRRSGYLFISSILLPHGSVDLGCVLTNCGRLRRSNLWEILNMVIVADYGIAAINHTAHSLREEICRSSHAIEMSKLVSMSLKLAEQTQSGPSIITVSRIIPASVFFLFSFLSRELLAVNFGTFGDLPLATSTHPILGRDWSQLEPCLRLKRIF